MGWAGRSVRGRVRTPLTSLGAALALAVAATGCGVDTTDTPTSGTPPPTASGSTIVGVTPGTLAADQTPPTGTNGIRYLDGRLWIADYAGNQLLVADAETGGILARFGAEAGVTGGPDDLVLGPDGTVYWTAFTGGGVGHLTLDGRSRTIAALPPGTNPIAWSTDGTLYVGEAVTADGLYEVTPPEGGQTSAPAPRTISDAVGNINAFDVGPGGLIYGPNYVDQTGTVVAIDPADGAVTTIADIPGYPTALRTIDDHRLLVLANLPSALYEVDLSTLPAADDPNPPEDPRATVTPRGDVALATVDNFTVAPDGTIYVTSFNQPTVLAIAPDGTTRTITIGTPS